MSIVPEKQRQFAFEIVERLREQGHIAYWAGGCVRDRLLGKVPKDYDVATSAHPDVVREIFGHRQTHCVGAAFGVITVVGPRQAGHVEVTTFRQDAGYLDGRHPEAVRFTDAAEDAARRDFTINGMFFDPVADEVIDYVSGRADLEQCVLRAIGAPTARFAEDKLRMLRAIRFAGTLGFTIEEQTFAAIQQMAAEISVVSPERIAQEMRLMLKLDQRAATLELLCTSGLMKAILPEVSQMRRVPQNKPRQPNGDLWDHTLLVMSELRRPSFELALGALLHDVGKPRTLRETDGKLSFHEHETVGSHIAEKVCLRWKLSNRETERIVWLVKHHMYLAHARRMRWAKLQRMLTRPGIDELLDLHEADAVASGTSHTDIDYCRELLTMPPQQLDPPAILSGHDLIRHGLAPGKVFHHLLERVRDAQLEKQIRTKREALELVDRLRNTEPSDAEEECD